MHVYHVEDNANFSFLKKKKNSCKLLCVLNSYIKLCQNPDFSFECQIWDYQERCVIFEHDSTGGCDTFNGEWNWLGIQCYFFFFGGFG